VSFPWTESGLIFI